jgi:hypothetical protein
MNSPTRPGVAPSSEIRTTRGAATVDVAISAPIAPASANDETRVKREDVCKRMTGDLPLLFVDVYVAG